MLLARDEPAAAALEQALAVSRAIGTRGIEPQVHAELAALHRRAGDAAAAERATRTAREGFLAIGAALKAAQVAWRS